MCSSSHFALGFGVGGTSADDRGTTCCLALRLSGGFSLDLEDVAHHGVWPQDWVTGAWTTAAEKNGALLNLVVASLLPWRIAPVTSLNLEIGLRGRMRHWLRVSALPDTRLGVRPFLLSWCGTRQSETLVEIRAVLQVPLPNRRGPARAHKTGDLARPGSSDCLVVFLKH